MQSHDIREAFLRYFAERGHARIASAPLVPDEGDQTLLFTNAGMVPFKRVFLGLEDPPRGNRRATTAQKCVRAGGKHNDLEQVGHTARHHTFFEMLGNFSFGDYFKADAVPFAWNLLTREWGLAEDRLFPTVFKGAGGIPRDAEAFELWTRFVPASRITELGLEENFWQMGETGPCGRCSEIHYFRGEDIPCLEPVCKGVECSCQRYVEVWNNVFMEFDRDASGTLTPLPAPSIDTGMGLERIAAVIQDKLSNYDTDLFTPILSAISARAGRPYGGSTELDHPDVSMRVIADHLRAMTFLIADGVLPSNEWRGYVLRKIMRRAMRHGKKLGFAEPTLHLLVDTVIGEMGDAYPELRAGRASIVRTVKAEEERFDVVLTSGLPKLEDLFDRVKAAGQSVVPGADVFRLYDSLGVPLDFAQDLAEQRGLTIDQPAVDAAMEAQRGRARANTKFKGGAALTYPPHVLGHLQPLGDVFTGYDRLEEPSATVVEILAVSDDAESAGRSVAVAEPGGEYWVHMDRTPFYLHAGGQESDTGQLVTAGGLIADVVSVEPAPTGCPRRHGVTIRAGSLQKGDQVRAVVDRTRRDAIRRNHTATHLLHAALRQTLGTHVRQAGSLVAPDRLRFDFAHFTAMTSDERAAVERIVSEQIFRNTPVTTEVKSTEDAIKGGAMALFGEKYGDKVRVVGIDAFSTELCGGTHVSATGDIGPFVITEDSGVAAGVRRIEALTGAGAVAHLQRTQAVLSQTLHALGVPADQAPGAVARLQSEARRLARENEQLKMKLALGGGAQSGDHDGVVAIGDAKFLARRVSGLDKSALRGLSDSLRDRLKRGVVVIAAESDGKVQLLVTVTKDLTDRVQAGQLVKALAPMVGGGGGGRPDFAEAGGKDASGIDAMLERAKALVTEAIGS
jgi:alanyl-tRNA synthetase